MHVHPEEPAVAAWERIDSVALLLDEPGAAGLTGAMPTVYKNSRGQRAVRQWCSEALARADFPLTNATLDTSVGRVKTTSAGTGRERIIPASTGPPRHLMCTRCGTAAQSRAAMDEDVRPGVTPGLPNH